MASVKDWQTSRPRRIAYRPRKATPKLYHELASWWHLISPPAHYAEEAAFYQHALLEACHGLPRVVLELGSGGGNNASHLKSRFQMVLVDPSPDMLAVSRELNPECVHIEGDMRTVRLGREFDGVLIHDAVMYMATESDLRQALETAFAHLRPGGAAVFAPDQVRETFQASTRSGGHDTERRGIRYVEWTWDPDPDDTTFVVDFAYLLRGEDGFVRVEHDRHTLGLFSRDQWLRLLRDVGFEPRVLAFKPAEADATPQDVFVGTRPTLGYSGPGLSM